MSDNDPMLDWLRERLAEYEREKSDLYVRINEVEKIIEQLIDGRSRVSRQRKAARDQKPAAMEGATGGEPSQPDREALSPLAPMAKPGAGI